MTPVSTVQSMVSVEIDTGTVAIAELAAAHHGTPVAKWIVRAARASSPASASLCCVGIDDALLRPGSTCESHDTDLPIRPARAA